MEPLESMDSQVELATKQALKVNFDNIPASLKSADVWVIWKYELDKEGKLKKPPFNARTGNRANHSNPATFSSFEKAKAAYESGGYLYPRGYAGVGFVLTGQGMVGIDIDDCIKDGHIDPVIIKVIHFLGSYAEVSPSGTGIRIFIKGKLPGAKRRTGRYEMYEDKRYVTVTGHIIEGSPREISDDQEKLNRVYARIFSIPTRSSAPQPHEPHAQRQPYTPPHELSMSEQADKIIQRGIERSSNFRRYFEGDQTLWGGTGRRHRSKSEAVWNFCLMLAYRTYGNRALMDEIFRRSGLYDKKWDRPTDGDKTYGQVTIQRAIDAEKHI